MIKPSRVYDVTNVRDTISRINSLVERNQLKQQDIVRATGIEKSKLSRWLKQNSRWASIGGENYGRILDFIGERNLFAESGYERPDAASSLDAAYHGMVVFFGLDAAAIDEARRNLVGHYVGWRYSLFAPPDILKGAMDIEFDEVSHALKTHEHYRVPAGVIGPDSQEINFMRVGYIWPTRHNMYVMISEKNEHKDIQIAYLNKSLVNSNTLEKGSMHTVEGVVLDWQGPDFYWTKLLLQKLPKPLPRAEIGLKSEKEVPTPVLAKLKERFIGPHHYLRVYR